MAAAPLSPALSCSSVATLLADGRWWSGPALAARLGVTRAAVSARVARLRAMGVEVYALSGRGYRLSQPLELLNAASIRRVLTSEQSAWLSTLTIREQVDSTNAELARSAERTPHACWAEYQTAGRGRGARRWASPFGANLYLSVAHEFAAPRGPVGALSLAVGVALAETLTAAGAERIALKWPNDLWANGAKLGGILIEHRGQAGGAARVIVGVGLNMVMQPAQASGVDQPWTRLADHMPELPTRNAVAGRVLGAVIDALRVFEADGFEAFHRRWPIFDGVRDRAVRVLEAHVERFGIARGINADGSLRVEIDGRVAALYSGDVSLRVVE